MVELGNPEAAAQVTNKGASLVRPDQANLVGCESPIHEPPDIYLDNHLMDLKFSPVCNMVALSQVTGQIRVYGYTNTTMEELSVYNHHTESVRSIDFSPCGNILYASSKDMGFSVMSNGRVEGRLENCHSDAINKIAHLEGDHVIATGDDSGVVKIWDLR